MATRGRKPKNGVSANKCSFCEGFKTHWGVKCPACDGTGLKKVQTALDTVYRVKNGGSLRRFKPKN